MAFDLNETQKLIRAAEDLDKWILENVVPVLKEFGGEVRYDFGGPYSDPDAGRETTMFHIGVSHREKRWRSDGGLLSWGGPGHAGVGQMYGGCSDHLNGYLPPEILEMIPAREKEIKENLMRLALEARGKALAAK